MGTRGSVGVITKSGEYKSSYNHFDSYPSGLGQEMVSLIMRINKEKKWDVFSKKMEEIKFVDDDQEPTEEERNIYSKYHQNVSSGTDWYSLLRDLQGTGLFEEILNGEDIQHMINSNGFIEDSLFCEYAYIINLQNGTFEVYEGFQSEPQKGNRFGEKADERSSGDYYPCALREVINFEDVSEEWMNSIDERISDETYQWGNPWMKEIRNDKFEELGV